MSVNGIPTDRILSRLDSFFAKNDYVGAERHLKFWLNEAKQLSDKRGALQLSNELIGLSRKIGNYNQVIEYSKLALDTLNSLDMSDSVTAATTYINIATAYKAFGEASISIPLFEKALDIYIRYLPSNDARFGALYNNLALSLCDLGRFKEAYSFYNMAIEIMVFSDKGELEQAITYLNIASALEAEKGLIDADEQILKNLDKAIELLDLYKEFDDGYYAFICEKCASVFGYYGYFFYEKELKERAKRIYERH